MHACRTDLVAALGLDRDVKPLVSIVGGGGKSTLMFRLASRLPGRVVTTTTTRIFASQRDLAAAVCSDEPHALETALRQGVSGLLVVGPIEGERARGVAPDLPARILAHPRVDAVVLEADGSRMRPAKAPADHEPVVPYETTLLVAVAGIDVLDAALVEACHRPERVVALTGDSPDAPISRRGLAMLLRHPDGGMKSAPSDARRTIFLNKVEGKGARRAAREVARLALEAGGVDRVVAGSLHRESDGFDVFTREPVGLGGAG